MALLGWWDRGEYGNSAHSPAPMPSQSESRPNCFHALRKSVLNRTARLRSPAVARALATVLVGGLAYTHSDRIAIEARRFNDGEPAVATWESPQLFASEHSADSMPFLVSADEQLSSYAGHQRLFERAEVALILARERFSVYDQSGIDARVGAHLALSDYYEDLFNSLPNNYPGQIAVIQHAIRNEIRGLQFADPTERGTFDSRLLSWVSRGEEIMTENPAFRRDCHIASALSEYYAYRAGEMESAPIPQPNQALDFRHQATGWERIAQRGSCVADSLAPPFSTDDSSHALQIALSALEKSPTGLNSRFVPGYEAGLSAVRESLSVSHTTHTLPTGAPELLPQGPSFSP